VAGNNGINQMRLARQLYQLCSVSVSHDPDGMVVMDSTVLTDYWADRWVSTNSTTMRQIRFDSKARLSSCVPATPHALICRPACADLPTHLISH